MEWYESIKMVRNGAAGGVEWDGVGWAGREGTISSYCQIRKILLIKKKREAYRREIGLRNTGFEEPDQSALEATHRARCFRGRGSFIGSKVNDAAAMLHDR